MQAPDRGQVGEEGEGGDEGDAIGREGPHDDAAAVVGGGILLGYCCGGLPANEGATHAVLPWRGHCD